MDLQEALGENGQVLVTFDDCITGLSHGNVFPLILIVSNSIHNLHEGQCRCNWSVTAPILTQRKHILVPDYHLTNFNNIT